MNNFKYLNSQFIISILFIFLFGTLSHFIYSLTGNLSFIGAFFPVNESIWEHLKLLLIHIISWWIFFYIFNKNKLSMDKDNCFFASIISLLSSMIFQLSVFYFYTGAFGLESFIIDILIFLFAIIFGQFIGLHIYKYSTGINYKISFFILIIIVLFFIYITFNSPHLPIFLDRNTGIYGL